jgi:hypothetical protein
MSAEQGEAYAQCNLAILLENGWGVAKNPGKAANYFKKAEESDPFARLSVYGQRFEHGWGLPMNLEEAAKHYKTAMEKGDPSAAVAYERVMSQLQARLNGPDSVAYLLKDLFAGRIVEKIGTGGSGSVYRVDHPDLGECAVKEYNPNGEIHEKEFMREGHALVSLVHPCILKILGFCLPRTEKEGARIATEYMANGSLGDILRRVKKGDIPSFWTPDGIAMIIVGTAVGMEHMHSHHVIHRDLKPGNILIGGDGLARIGDFGSTKFTDLGWTTTQTGTIGTLLYMSPEVVNGESATEKVDVYAFGLILYEILFTSGPTESVGANTASPVRIS